MSYYNNPYSTPDKYGLTTVGQVEWSEPCYDFDLTVVWWTEDGRLYWADDSGCSCPSPFEDFTKLDELTTGTVFDLSAHLERRRGETNDGGAYAGPQIVDLLARIRLNRPGAS